MSDSHRSRERQALAPLLALARGKSARELQAWLAYLRVEGPTVAARLERVLAEGEGRGADTPDASPAVPSSPARDGGAMAPNDGAAASRRAGVGPRRYVAPSLSRGLAARPPAPRGD